MTMSFFNRRVAEVGAEDSEEFSEFSVKTSVPLWLNNHFTLYE